MTDLASSTGLPSRTAAALAYGGWWVTGLIIWFLERQDRFARFHAAQSVVTFGALSALIFFFGLLAAASLSFLPSAFTALIGVMDLGVGARCGAVGGLDVEGGDGGRLENTWRERAR